MRQYLAAYGPATRDDIVQFTGFKIRQIAPALDGMRTFEDEQGRTLYDVPRAPFAADASGAGAVPAGVRLDHPRAPRPLADRPARVLDDGVQQEERHDEETFTVDGFVAGAWRIEKRELEAASSHSRRCRTKCGARSTPRASG